eukprot:7429237-Pyramimonas_sp.AAC.1
MRPVDKSMQLTLGKRRHHWNALRSRNPALGAVAQLDGAPSDCERSPGGQQVERLQVMLLLPLRRVPLLRLMSSLLLLG